MPIKQTFEYRGNDEAPNFGDWANSLTGTDFLRWKQAEKNQLALRKSAIDQGILQVNDDGSYEYNTEWTVGKEHYEYKEYDEVWLEFWNRYLDETGIVFVINEELIEEE